MNLSSDEYKYIKKYRIKKIIVFTFQVLIALTFLIIWELLSKYEVIDSFIFSSPLRILKTLIYMFKENNLIYHIWVTFYEVVISFMISVLLSLIISTILYESEFLSSVFDPYLTMLNSLPKVALGPIIIIWVGSNIKSIILMSILISIIISIQTIYNGFINTDKSKIKLLKTFNAKRMDILFKVVYPYNYKLIVNSLKISISMCLIGVITGEFLTSKAGVGYLILYGSQVFNLNLVLSGIFILIIMSIFLYNLIKIIEKHLTY